MTTISISLSGWLGFFSEILTMRMGKPVDESQSYLQMKDHLITVVHEQTEKTDNGGICA